MLTSVLRAAVLGLGLAIAASPVALADGDAKAGKKVFRKCKACHTVQEGKHRQGPSLHGVYGRKAGSLEGFTRYSDEMKAYGAVWDEATLSAYLENPRKAVPGNGMHFSGLKNAKERDDMIAYLKAISE